MIRIATIGTSMITENLLEVMADNPQTTFVGTLSRDGQRAWDFTREHGGTQAFCSLEELAASPDVDAVYIASPNALHCQQALSCIRGGKHVLVEKPLAANRRDASRVFAAAREAGVVALEAMRPLHDPAFITCRDAMAELGTIRRATLRFGKYSSRYDDLLAGRATNIFDCRMASGALMDIGVYCVEPMVALFGEPQRITAQGILLDPETQNLTGGAIDGAGVVCASYPGMVATIHHSKITADLASSQIEGELGTLTFDSISCPSSARVDMRGQARRNAAKQTGYSATKTSTRGLALPACENTMCYELADFACAIEAVRAGQDPSQAPAGPLGTVGDYRGITLASLSIMDEARRQMGVRFPADAE